jgi:response regulator of citrate/malate metabolism
MAYRVLIVGVDRVKRNHLKEAVSASGLFSHVTSSSSLKDAQKSMELGEKLDVIFIRNEFSLADLAKFISDGKEFVNSRDAAYITVLDEKDSGAGEVTKNVLGGADGILIAPFSVDRLQGITVLADKVRRERVRERNDKLLRFLVQSIKASFQKVANEARDQAPTFRRNLKEFRNLCQIIETFEQDVLEYFHEILIETFGALPPPAKSLYAGASERVKKKLEKAAKPKAFTPIAQ